LKPKEPMQGQQPRRSPDYRHRFLGTPAYWAWRLHTLVLARQVTRRRPLTCPASLPLRCAGLRTWRRSQSIWSATAGTSVRRLSP
jgi:hypothetical protein